MLLCNWVELRWTGSDGGKEIGRQTIRCAMMTKLENQVYWKSRLVQGRTEQYIRSQCHNSRAVRRDSMMLYKPLVLSLHTNDFVVSTIITLVCAAGLRANRSAAKSHI